MELDFFATLQRRALTISSISAERTCMVRRGSRLGSWSLYWTIWGYDIVKYDGGTRNKALIDTLTNNMSNNNVLRLMYKERKR
jgi:hypothetical protein